MLHSMQQVISTLWHGIGGIIYPLFDINLTKGNRGCINYKKKPVLIRFFIIEKVLFYN